MTTTDEKLDKLVDAITALTAAQNPQPQGDDSYEKMRKREEDLAKMRIKRAAEELSAAEGQEAKEVAQIARVEAHIALLEIKEKLSNRQKQQLKDLRKLLNQTNKARAKENDELQDNIAAMNDVANNLAGAIGLRKSFLGTMAKGLKAWRSDTEAAKKNKKAIKEMFSARAIAASAGMKAMELGVAGFAHAFTAQEDVMAEYNKTTGRGVAEADRLKTAWVRLQPAGADITSGLRALESAFPTNQLADFGYGVAESIALWEKFGVSADAAAKNFTDLTKAFGQDPFQAQETQRDIMELAMVMRKPPGEMVSAFQEAMPRLSLYTGQLKDNFTKLSIASAQLAVPTDAILGFNDSLKTIAGSSEFAGKLNSILGKGLIDPMNMMKKAFDDPLAPLLEVRRAYRLAGKDITKVAGAELEMMAGTMGVDGVTFKKMMTGKMSTDAIRKKLKDANMDERSIAMNSSKTLEKIFNLLKYVAGRMFGGTATDLTKSINAYIKGADAEITGVKKPAEGGFMEDASLAIGSSATGLAGYSALGQFAKAAPHLKAMQGGAGTVARRMIPGGALLSAGANAIRYNAGTIGKWEAILGTAGSIGGMASGAVAGGALTAATGVGGLATPALMTGGAVGGEILGEKLGKWIDEKSNSGFGELVQANQNVANSQQRNTEATEALTNAYTNATKNNNGNSPYQIINSALGG